METGRELDALIAEKIMGWKILEVKQRYVVEKHLIPPGMPEEEIGVCEYITGILVAPCTPSSFLPRYSTEIEDAWEVVDRLSKDYQVKVIQDKRRGAESKGSNNYCCKITSSMGFANIKTHNAFSEKSISHAICLAALKAMEE